MHQRQRESILEPQLLSAIIRPRCRDMGYYKVERGVDRHGLVDPLDARSIGPFHHPRMNPTRVVHRESAKHGSYASIPPRGEDIEPWLCRTDDHDPYHRASKPFFLRLWLPRSRTMFCPLLWVTSSRGLPFAFYELPRLPCQTPSQCIKRSPT